MSTHTRRRLLFCVILVALTLPAELVLLRAVTTDTQSAATTWVERLPAASLEAVADNVQQYPFEYRKAVMARLAPARRAEVWAAHIAAYRDARPELSTEQVEALNVAIEAARAVLGHEPTSRAAQQSVQIVAQRIVDLFGADVADDLLYRLGSRQTRLLASAEPWNLKLSRFVREKFVAQAETWDCHCNVEFGCDVLALTWCDGAVNCRIDDRWPMCGWFWNEICDGVCKVAMIGG